MTNLTELQNLVDRFHANIDFSIRTQEMLTMSILAELNILILC